MAKKAVLERNKIKIEELLLLEFLTKQLFYSDFVG